MHIDLLAITEHLLQLGQGRVASLAHPALEQLKLSGRKAGRLASAMRQRRKVRGLAPLAKHLVDEGNADAECFSDLRDCALSLLIVLDDSLA